MPPSKSKCWYSNYCLHFLKQAVPLSPLELNSFIPISGNSLFAPTNGAANPQPPKTWAQVSIVTKVFSSIRWQSAKFLQTRHYATLEMMLLVIRQCHYAACLVFSLLCCVFMHFWWLAESLRKLWCFLVRPEPIEVVHFPGTNTLAYFSSPRATKKEYKQEHQSL